MNFDILTAVWGTFVALDNEIIPTIRAITIDLDPKLQLLYLYFYCDGPITEDLQEIASCTECEVSARFPPLEFQSNENLVIRLDYPEPIPIKGRLVYLRHEIDQQFEVEVIEPCPTEMHPSANSTLIQKIGQFLFPKWMSKHNHFSNDKPIKHQIFLTKKIPDPLLDVDLKRLGNTQLGKLYTMSGLLGNVTPNLRTVLVDMNAQEKKFDIYFYYDGEITDLSEKLAANTLNKIKTQLPPDFKFNQTLNRVDYPNEILYRIGNAYLRKENGDARKIIYRENLNDKVAT